MAGPPDAKDQYSDEHISMQDARIGTCIRILDDGGLSLTLNCDHTVVQAATFQLRGSIDRAGYQHPVQGRGAELRDPYAVFASHHVAAVVLFLESLFRAVLPTPVILLGVTSKCDSA